MERQNQAPMLIDAVIHAIGDPKMTAKLDKLDAAVPWDQLAAPILATYGNSTSAGGRPNVPVVMMLKVMMLQKWFNLSDAAAEGMLRDRISFRRFVGIGLTDEVIDEPSLGTWEYLGTYTREFLADGRCILRSGKEVVWTKKCVEKSATTVILEGGYEHKLEGEVLKIEGRYEAKRRKE